MRVMTKSRSKVRGVVCYTLRFLNGLRGQLNEPEQEGVIIEQEDKGWSGVWGQIRRA